MKVGGRLLVLFCLLAISLPGGDLALAQEQGDKPDTEESKKAEEEIQKAESRKRKAEDGVLFIFRTALEIFLIRRDGEFVTGRITTRDNK